MNQRLLIGIIILTGIGSIGSVLAYSGSISAAQGNFNNVLVTGTCTGCGGEGSFTTYTTIYNGTVTGSDNSFQINIIQIANDGSLIAYDSNNNSTVISTSHTILGFGGSDSGSNANKVQYGLSSASGEYKFTFTTGTGKFQVFKNNSLLQSFTIDKTQFTLGSMGQVAMGISANGKFIEVYGPSNSGTENRLLVFQGS